MSFFLDNLLRKFGKALVGEKTYNSKESQLILYHTYRDMAVRKSVPCLSEVGFRCYSQFEEDGILLFIFALIGVTNKTVVEICAGDGRECMSTNLLLNHGWWGYLFDGDEKKVNKGRDFFKNSSDTFLYPPKFTHAWVTAENVNHLISEAGITGDIDLFSLDIDGMDYWVWKAITCVKPRVVVCETHNIIAPDLAITVPYDPKFIMTDPDYCSASLAAMTKLADEKGYRLVGTNRYGFNAFFILKELAVDLLPTVTPDQCLSDPFTKNARAMRWPKVKDKHWVNV